MNDYVQYHNSDVMGSFRDMDDGDDDKGFSILTNKTFSRKIIGDRIWLIAGAEKPRKYYLCYYFFVDEANQLINDPDFKFIVQGQKGRAFKPEIPLSDEAWFKDFLKSQQNFSMGLRKIEKRFVDELEKVISAQEMPNLSVDEQAQKVGGGFGNSETNRKVEQAAIFCVTDDYKKRGWLVESVESEKCGFDLLCMKSNIQEHVEVKGVQGDLVSFIITSGEVKQSKSDGSFVLYVVTSALSVPKLHKFTAKEFTERFVLEAISYRASLKQG